MGDRAADKRAFLARLRLTNAQVTVLKQDASSRSYDRVTTEDGDSLVLMDVGQEGLASLDRFSRIGGHLIDIGLSAPRVLERDDTAGLALIEDFGDQRFADVPGDEGALYGLAIDVLTHLQTAAPLSDLPICDVAHLAELAATAWDWYGDSEDREQVVGLIHNLADAIDMVPSCMMLRDYHAENLMWLPHQSGLKRAGLLDFQDAMLGHPAFDVVSLLQDARRDVPVAFEAEFCARFVAATDAAPQRFQESYTALGAIRNLRILGVFARLAQQSGRTAYLKFCPRVWRYLQRDLSHPALAELKQLVQSTLPEPTETHLKNLTQP
jgi:aminoglycoside/choline kinase family phosphotransferase